MVYSLWATLAGRYIFQTIIQLHTVKWVLQIKVNLKSSNNNKNSQQQTVNSSISWFQVIKKLSAVLSKYLWVMQQKCQAEPDKVGEIESLSSNFKTKHVIEA